MQGGNVTSTTDLSAEELELFAYLLEEEGIDDNDQRLIPRRDPNAELPLSLGQERLWFLDQWDPGSPASNIPFALRLTGQLSIDAFGRSLNEIVRRHEALRTTFLAINDQLRQVVAPSLNIPLPLLDLRNLPKAHHEAEVQRLIMHHAQHRFDLVGGPLLRAELIRLSEQEHVFLLNVHHIVFDAWSVGLFLRELTMLYDAFVHDQPSPLPELAIQYSDFAIWQRQWLQDEVLQGQLDYWKRHLGGSLPVLELPSDHPRPPMLTYQGALAYHTLPLALSQKLTEFSQAEGVTLFMTTFAAFQTLLYRYTGEEDIITGSMYANRDFVDIEALMAFFVNTFLLRTDLSGNPTFREFLGRVREIALEAFAHQNVPFEQLIDELRPPRDTSHTSLFQVMFILQNAPVPAQAKHDLQVEFLRVDNKTSKLDLTLSLTETPDGLRVVAEYKTDLFDETTIERLMGHYQVLLEEIVEDADRRLSDLSLLDEAERHQLLAWNETQAPFSEHACIHQLFEAQAERTPDAPALEFGGRHLSYRELNQRANQLAHHLRALGIQPEERVGICVERSFELIIGLLGILKAGAAYVPLDPTYPTERLQFMLADSRVAVVLTYGEIGDWRLESDAANLQSPISHPQSQIVRLDADWPQIGRQPEANPAVELGSRQQAYVIYTSGSVGQPKGVLIEHRSLVHYTEAAREAYAIKPGERVLQFASISFDASAEEIYIALTSGATLVLRNDQMIETIETFLQTCDAWRINVLSLPTAYWHELVARMASEALTLPETLRLTIIGGERALPERVALWQEHVGARVQLINTYGPTESTVVATMFPVPHEAPAGALREVPIGWPIRNVTAYVLDRYLAPVPIGVPGELYLGGAGLARGYLNHPELTAERFVPCPWSVVSGQLQRTTDNGQLTTDNRLYKTGDLVRLLPDGAIEFLGRVDHQVKIRGFRIELGEVEAALRQNPALSDAVVTAREDTPGDKRLVAYIVPDQEQRTKNKEQKSETPDSQFSILNSQFLGELRGFLRERLPDYMLPTAFVTLERLPLTGSGKVNLRGLPAPDNVRPELGNNFVAPRNPTEEQIAAMWLSVLKLEHVGIYDNFFELGGHSLLATQLIARLRTTFQVDLPVRHLFASPTVAGIAEMIETIRWVAQGAAVPVGADEAFEEGEL